ncbi:MAG: 3-dehydroquinate synthase [Clostridiales bacterium]|nr:3-dehydroquinate synthase [Clostridiales bacterium]
MMKKLRVNAGKGYDIIIGGGFIKSCGDYIAKITNAKKIVIITDSNVAPFYLADVLKSIESKGFETYSYIFKAGETSKTTASVINMVEFLAEKQLSRSDLVVALGGGVCGDMAGFAAAVYLRGIDFVQIPTSLLAQVDSSVGGKTAVDLPQGKNLCGAFHQPVLVLIDTDVLKTLPKHYFSDGMEEVIKYGCIKSKAFFERLERENANDFLQELIFECVNIKREVVEKDEKEAGERALLNFGHTAGHAIEKLYNFNGISHGEAVGIGMVMISAAGEKSGITEKGTSKRISDLLKKYGLKTSDSHSVEDIVAAMGSDKKRTGNGINLVMLDSIGKSFIKPTPYSEISDLFAQE